MNSKAILFSCATVSLAVGIGFVWHSDEPEKVPENIAAKMAQTAAPEANRSTSFNQFSSLWGKAGAEPVAPEKAAIIEDLWKRAMTPADKLKPGDDAPDKLRKLAQSDPDVMKNLMGRYAREIDPNAKELLRSVLSTIEKPEILEFSKQLATSGDETQRKDGLAMLQNLSTDSQEVRNVLKQTLATERTPSVIVQALAALKPATVEPAESEAIITQLKGLTQNADPSVRGKSVLQLAQWDKTGAAQNTLSQALSDQAPEVRQAAIFAVAQSGTQSDSAKAALINMAGNVNESKEVRGSALQVLERFKLSKDETAKVSQARSDVLGL
ncbi:MAG: HEAT repeat domain-containing protein [Burkholderiaceae bacterium]